MSGMKADTGKPPTHLLAHDVVVSDHNPSQGIEFYMARLREWWSRAGTLPALQLNNDDYAGVVKILAFGAAKYGDRNWEEGIAYHRVFGAAVRHFAERGGLDEETKLPHRHHFLCCYMFLAAYTARGMHHFDDRPGVGPFYTHEQTRSVVRAVAGGVLVVPGFEDLAPPERWAIFRSQHDRSDDLPGEYPSKEAAEAAFKAHAPYKYVPYRAVKL
jgi:hypothetical protein